MPPAADRFHALIRGDTRGPAAWAARAGLWWARWPYAAGVWGRNRLFDAGWKPTGRAAVPVVSVGNLTLGGTGKTPCVESVARHYADAGRSVAILSRGYGSAAGRNDEAMVLEENLPDVPHLQGADRVSLAATAVEELESDILVLDDGFQHRRLGRDLDIVLVDALWTLECEYLFPRGTLREPVGSLRRAGVVLLTRCDSIRPEAIEAQRNWIRTRFPHLPVFATEHRPDPVNLPPGPCFAFCGIGNPEAFRRTLAGLGRPDAVLHTFPDHYNYTRADVDHLRKLAAELPPDGSVLTTQKDWVKLRLPDLAGRPLVPVRVRFAFRDGEAEFRALLDGVLPPEG